jgi:carboxyl-terminal processing protease
MRSNDVYSPTSGWSAVEKVANRMAASASRTAGTYQAIEYVIGQLQRAGDLHAEFERPSTAKASQAPGSSARGPGAPSVSLVAPRIGLIVLPWISASPQSAAARRYARTTLFGISRLQRGRHPCGWIVDLRGNLGGDMWPMLLSVEPLLSSGRLIGFTNDQAAPVWVVRRGDTLSGTGERATAPLRIADPEPPPAVAVLVGSGTVSSGEAVAVAFRGRAQTRTFGGATAGATDSAHTYRLADGATISLSTHWDVDRSGRVYRSPITPDVIVRDLGHTDPQPVKLATAWLQSMAACEPAN